MKIRKIFQILKFTYFGPAVAAAALAPGLLAGCGGKKARVAEAPLIGVTQKDALGETVAFPRSPASVVALSPGLAHMVYTFAEERLVAVSEDTEEPEALLGLPKIELYGDSGLARGLTTVARLRPEAVFARPGQFDQPEVLREELARAGAPVYFERFDGYDRMKQGMRNIARILDNEQGAEAFILKMEAFFERVKKAGPRRKTAKIAFVTSYEPLRAIGRDHHINGLLPYLRAENIFADSAGTFVEPTFDDFRRGRPDLIFVLTRDPAVAYQLHVVMPKFQGTPAYNSQLIEPVVPDDILEPGPQALTAMITLARNLQPGMVPLPEEIYREVFAGEIDAEE